MNIKSYDKEELQQIMHYLYLHLSAIASVEKRRRAKTTTSTHLRDPPFDNLKGYGATAHRPSQKRASPTRPVSPRVVATDSAAATNYFNERTKRPCCTTNPHDMNTANVLTIDH